MLLLKNTQGRVLMPSFKRGKIMLFIDIETFSSTDLKKSGMYKYAESSDFEILLFGYSIGGEAIKVIDLANGEKLPGNVLQDLLDDKVLKFAHNAGFERVCLSKMLKLDGKFLNPKSWRCTMVWSAYLGLPLTLDGVGSVLELENQKFIEGKELIRYFCMPCKPTKKNLGRTRNLPHHDLNKWERFKAYNIRDVETEMEIAGRLSKFPVPEDEWLNYRLDQEINDRGIAIDLTLVKNATKCDEIARTELTESMKEITGIENPNSITRLKLWFDENGLKIENLRKKDVANAIRLPA
jgi:DNA polymerase